MKTNHNTPSSSPLSSSPKCNIKSRRSMAKKGGRRKGKEGREEESHLFHTLTDLQKTTSVFIH